MTPTIPPITTGKDSEPLSEAGLDRLRESRWSRMTTEREGVSSPKAYGEPTTSGDGTCTCFPRPPLSPGAASPPGNALLPGDGQKTGSAYQVPHAVRR